MTQHTKHAWDAASTDADIRQNRRVWDALPATAGACARLAIIGRVAEILANHWGEAMQAEQEAGWPCPMMRAAARAGGVL